MLTLLRNAYLQQVWLNVDELFRENGLVASQVKEQSIVNVQAQPAMTKMDYMMADVSKVLPADTAPGTSIKAADFVLGVNIDPYLAGMKDALSVLKDVPTASLERLFTEHLDLCSYRLDAWQTGMFTRRLEYLRNKTTVAGETTESNRGIYLGAFGWLEDIRPDTSAKREVSPENIPAKLRETDKGQVYEDDSNGGYIHGFSLNHALTGAVLRSAYLSHAADEYADTMSVNLSSARVRTALYYLDGVRNGQTLSSLLGYQLERGMHDNYPTLNLDQYIYALREKYPLISSELEPEETSETIPAGNVVDGYALLEASKSSSYPWDAAGLPSASSAEGEAIIAEIAKMADAMDALGDLALTESVYHIVQGNYERGGAVLKSLSEGKNPPEPEVANTPRKGNMITNRVMLNLEVEPAVNAWGSTLSPKASAEKGLNNWLAGMLGDADKIRCVVTATYVDATTGSDTIISDSIRLSQLDMQPLDFVLMTDATLGNGSSGLEKHIAYAFRVNNHVSDVIPVSIGLQDRDTGWD